MAYIYALLDPRDYRIYYIGQTVQSPDDRLRGHLMQPTNPMMRMWFDELSALDLCPLIRLVEEVSENCVDARESFWISILIHHGIALKNARLPDLVGTNYFQDFPVREKIAHRPPVQLIISPPATTQEPQSEEPSYTPNEIADKYRVTRQAIYNWIASGRLRAVKSGEGVRVPESALQDFIRPA